jgi:hypothetical protein
MGCKTAMPPLLLQPASSSDQIERQNNATSASNQDFLIPLYLPSISVKKRLVTARSRDITEFFDFYSTGSIEIYGSQQGREGRHSSLACGTKARAEATLVWLKTKNPGNTHPL